MKSLGDETAIANDVVFFRFLFALSFLRDVCVSLVFVFTNKKHGAGVCGGSASSGKLKVKL